MDNYLTDQEPIFNEENDQSPIYVEYDVSFNSLPLENRYNTILRHLSILQRKNDLLVEENEDTYRLWSDLSKKSFRNEELLKQNAELNRRLKESDKKISELIHLSALKDKEISKLTLSLLTKRK